MAIDYAEKEREFLESLAEDTGRDLAGWMSAIAATALTDRNAIIDWLRQQGFLFARASWLERIYHNGGRPIYLDPADLGGVPPVRGTLASAPAIVASRPDPLPIAAAREPLAVTPTPAAVFNPPPAPSPSLPSSGPTLDALLTEAKGYRPLAQLLLREIEKRAPEVQVEARTGYLALACKGRIAGVLTLSAKELRLALVWPADAVVPAGFVRAKFPKTATDMPAEISHMIILTDARQVTPELIGAVVRAASRV